MTRFTKQIRVNASQADVWKVMANLGDIYRFNPGVSKSYYSTDSKEGVGSGRICELRPAGKVEEIVTSWEEGKSFLLQIHPLEKAPPLKQLYASLLLESKTPSATDVYISMKYETKLGVIGKLLNALMIREQMEKSIFHLLQGLKIHLEKGHEIENPRALKDFLEVA